MLGSERTNVNNLINTDRYSTSNQLSRRSKAPQIYIVLRSSYLLPCKFPDTTNLPFDHGVQREFVVDRVSVGVNPTDQRDILYTERLVAWVGKALIRC